MRPCSLRMHSGATWCRFWCRALRSGGADAEEEEEEDVGRAEEAAAREAPPQRANGHGESDGGGARR